MSRKTIIAGNWKLNKTAAEGKALVEALKAKVAGIDSVEVVVCPPFTTLSAVVEAAAGSNVAVGAQNVHWETTGAFTGEISATMLKEVGVTWAITGHSERRQYFAETDETVNKRTKAALAAGLKVMVCIGETLDQREDAITNAVCEIQLRRGLMGITADQMKDIVVAYEPVWAIGTGKVATPEMAQDTHAACRSVLTDMFGAEVAETIRLQYGGSMKAGNGKDLTAQKDIDGGLIGGASLTAEDFSALIDVVK